MNIRTLVRSLVILSGLGAGPLFAQKALELANVEGNPDFAFARVPNSPDLEPPILTIEAWLTPQGTGQGGAFFKANVVAMTAEGVAGNFPMSYALGWREWDQRVFFSIGRTLPTSGSLALSLSVVPIGTTVHVAALYYPAGSFFRQEIYLDGKLDSTQLTSAVIPYDLDSDLLIGASNQLAGNEHRFDGIVDDVRIWDHQRTAKQIRRKMHCRLRGREPGLLAYYTFDGKDVRDRSGNGHHGTLEGTAFGFVGPMTALSPCFAAMATIIDGVVTIQVP